MTKQSISSKIFKKNTGESCRNLRSSTRRRRKLMILSVNSIIWTKIFKDQRFPSMIQSSKCLITNLWTRSKWASWMKDHIKLKHQSHRETEIEMIAETLSKCSMIYPTMKEVLPGDVFQEWAKLMITLKTTSAKISKAIMQSNLRIFILDLYLEKELLELFLKCQHLVKAMGQPLVVSLMVVLPISPSTSVRFKPLSIDDAPDNLPSPHHVRKPTRLNSTVESLMDERWAPPSRWAFKIRMPARAIISRISIDPVTPILPPMPNTDTETGEVVEEPVPERLPLVLLQEVSQHRSCRTTRILRPLPG